MVKITGIVGGSLVGKDPFSAECWSGSSKYFFSECQRQGILQNTIGVEVPLYQKYYYILRNFKLNKIMWRQMYHLDTGYYRALTKKIQFALSRTNVADACLQIGGIYDVPGILKGSTGCFSYHDGNFVQLHKSPFFPSNISENICESAYQYEKKVYHGMNGIFTMSHYLRKSFINDFGIPSEKVHCIGAGVNIDNIPENVNKTFDKKNILFVGVDFVRKGGEDLVKAFNLIHHNFPDAILNIVGPSRLPKKYCDHTNIIYHGFLSKNEPVDLEKLKRLYIDATLFVLPSYYEPFGIAPLEAMIYKTPCVLTNDWAFPEMVNNGNCGLLVKCGDCDDIADKISLLLCDTDKLAKVGESAREFVLRNFTWKNVVDRMNNIFDDWKDRN